MMHPLSLEMNGLSQVSPDLLMRVVALAKPVAGALEIVTLWPDALVKLARRYWAAKDAVESRQVAVEAPTPKSWAHSWFALQHYLIHPRRRCSPASVSF
mmetsp:Transcript_55894/g.107868  ORF Transcript_55894/g.107868 Transcript_55894/m.107868 type:complete len:99 (-) Transcript_55894:107-403(-)